MLPVSEKHKTANLLPEKRQTWLSTISQHIEKWQKNTRMSRESITASVVESLQNYEKRLPELPQNDANTNKTGLGFKPFDVPKSGNDKNYKNNADRLYRWLDVAGEGKTLPINILPAVLSAMPEENRIHCIDVLLGDLGLQCSWKNNIFDTNAGKPMKPVHEWMQASQKEGYEAQQALLSLLKSAQDIPVSDLNVGHLSDVNLLETARREIKDMMLHLQEVQHNIDLRLEELKPAFSSRESLKI